MNSRYDCLAQNSRSMAVDTTCGNAGYGCTFCDRYVSSSVVGSACFPNYAHTNYWDTDCDTNCEYCNGAGNDGCTKCSADPDLHLRRHPQRLEGWQFCACEMGWYDLNADSNIAMVNCQPCSDLCHHCEDDTDYCLTCDEAAYRGDDGKCLNQCPVGFVAINIGDDGICVADTSKNEYPIEHRAMPEDNPDWRCDNGCYWDGYQCQLCDASCLSCSGPAATDCTACQFEDFILTQGSCVACPVGAPPNYLDQCVEQCDANPHNYLQMECHDGDSPNAAGDGCDADCKLEDGWACWHPTLDLTYQTCEFVDYTTIRRIIASNDNNLIIEFTKPVTYTDLDADDLWVIVSTDEHYTEFSEPLPWTLPDQDDHLPSHFITLMIDISQED